MIPATPTLLALLSLSPRHIVGICRRHRGLHPRRLQEGLDTLRAYGLVIRDGDHWRLTDAGAAAQAGLRRAA